MKKEFVIRGQTASSGIETINFGTKNGYAHRLVEFQVYPSVLGTAAAEVFGSITAGKNEANPVSPDFNDDGLIANAMLIQSSNPAAAGVSGPVTSIVNDMFLITQNLILSVRDTDGSAPVNWQCRFKPVKMSGSNLANQNYRQFMIFDE